MAGSADSLVSYNTGLHRCLRSLAGSAAGPLQHRHVGGSRQETDTFEDPWPHCSLNEARSLCILVKFQTAVRMETSCLDFPRV